MNHDFEIHAPRISEEELEAIIRRRLASRNLDPAEIERVESLSFSPLSGAGMKGFDPAETADLFERSATVPNFRSGKFRWLKGPLAGLARWVYRMSSALMDKLSEHKVEAFYNVIGELIFLRRQVSDLQARVGADPSAYQRSADLYAVPPTQQMAELEQDSIYQGCVELLSILEEESIQAPLSIVDDAGGFLQIATSRRGLESDSIASMDLIFQDSYYLRPGSVVAIPSFQNLRCSPAYLISALRRFAGQHSYLLIGADLAPQEYYRALISMCVSRGYKLLQEKAGADRHIYLFVLK
ncbi:MAG: hypothetical protein CMN76_07155 [Spirochaetaceae bacterium]|nr:hypothetical protein [Spirochaetaceae bacterium]